MPGGEPYGLLVVDREVQHRPGPGGDDVSAMAGIAGIAAAAFVPTVFAAAPAPAPPGAKTRPGATASATPSLRRTLNAGCG